MKDYYLSTPILHFCDPQPKIPIPKFISPHTRLPAPCPLEFLGYSLFDISPQSIFCHVKACLQGIEDAAGVGEEQFNQVS